MGSTRYFTFELTEKAKNFIVLNGFDKEFGARFLKRTLNKFLLQPFSNLLGSEQIGNKNFEDHIIIDHEDNKEVLTFKLEQLILK